MSDDSELNYSIFDHDYDQTSIDLLGICFGRSPWLLGPSKIL